MDGYRAWLVGRGYSPSVVVRPLVTLGHLGRWLELNALAVDQLTAEAASSFLAEYRVDRGRLPGASVWPLLEYLRAEGAVPPEPPAVVAPVEQLVGEYRKWLVCERGLAPVTVRASERFARRFLAGRVSAGDPCGVLGITAGEVNAFLRVRAGEQRIGRVLRLSAAVAAALSRGSRRCRSRAGAGGSPGRALARGDDPAVPDATGHRPAPRLV
ncbi:MAG: hypothetical protein ACJ77G_03350 [Solirubrobacteraceae bacterium]